MEEHEYFMHTPEERGHKNGVPCDKNGREIKDGDMVVYSTDAPQKIVTVEGNLQFAYDNGTVEGMRSDLTEMLANKMQITNR